jgi:hypothetical protein
MANLHTTKSWTRADFHPTREKKTEPMHLDNPAAEYERLKKEGKTGRKQKQK